MMCPACEYDNLPGADTCEQCGVSLTQEDLPATAALSRLERSINRDPVEVLNPAAPIHISEETSLKDVLHALREGRVGCVLLTDSDGRLSGIFSERDALDRLALGEEDTAQAVSGFMTAEPETLRPDQPLAYALQRMHVGDFRHLPLTDHDGRPVGIISSRDIINYLEQVTCG